MIQTTGYLAKFQFTWHKIIILEWYIPTDDAFISEGKCVLYLRINNLQNENIHELYHEIQVVLDLYCCVWIRSYHGWVNILNTCLKIFKNNSSLVSVE